MQYPGPRGFSCFFFSLLEVREQRRGDPGMYVVKYVIFYNERVCVKDYFIT